MKKYSTKQSVLEKITLKKINILEKYHQGIKRKRKKYPLRKYEYKLHSFL